MTARIHLPNGVVIEAVGSAEEIRALAGPVYVVRPQPEQQKLSADSLGGVVCKCGHPWFEQLEPPGGAKA